MKQNDNFEKRFNNTTQNKIKIKQEWHKHENTLRLIYKSLDSYYRAKRGYIC